MKYVLVFGGSGYIGSTVMMDLIKKGYNVINIDKVEQSNPYFTQFYGTEIYRHISDDLSEYRVNTSDVNLVGLEDYTRGHEVIGAIHFAAYKDLPGSYEIPFDYYQNNLISLLTALRISKHLGAKRFIFSSSAGVYSDSLSGAVTEDMTTAGDSPYGYTKIVGERIVADVCRQFGIHGISLRYFNPIGKTQVSVDNSDSLFGNIKRCLQLKSKLTIFGGDYDTKDGTCVRDYIDLRDLSAAHIFCLESEFNSQAKPYDCFNVGTGTGTTVKEVAETVKSIKKDFQYEIGERRVGDAAGSYANPNRIFSRGFKCKYTLRDSIESLLR